MIRSYDVVVIGGGIIGSSIAFRLAQEKLRVALFDRRQPGREASWAAAGMLSPVPQNSADIPLVPFGRASLELYPGFVAEIEALSGRRVHCRRNGTIELLFSANAERELSTLVALHRALGLPTEPLPLDEAKKFEPVIGREAQAAAFLPYEASIDNRALTAGVLTAAESSGATVYAGVSVTQVLHDGVRCTGVIAAGETYLAGNVVLAAGAFSGALSANTSGIAAILTRPIRGQMVALRSSAAHIHRVLRSERGYIVPRDDADTQLLVAGTTLEDVGFEKRVTPRGLEQILSVVQELAPALANSEIVETWCGLRPDTPDHLPLLGPAEFKHLTIATGHYRNGILLAPITAKLVSEWITEGRVSMEWEIFSPQRFANAEANRND